MQIYFCPVCNGLIGKLAGLSMYGCVSKTHMNNDRTTHWEKKYFKKARRVK